MAATVDEIQKRNERCGGPSAAAMPQMRQQCPAVAGGGSAEAREIPVKPIGTQLARFDRRPRPKRATGGSERRGRQHTDYLDLFEAPDAEAAARVVMIVRSYGHAQTETWTALPWDRFETLLSTVVVAA